MKVIFEVVCNKEGDYFVRERARNGEIVSHSEAYSTKSNAKRAARRRAAHVGAKWTVIENTPPLRLRFPPLH